MLINIFLVGCLKTAPVAKFDPYTNHTVLPFPSDIYTHPDESSATSLQLDFSQKEIPLFNISRQDLNALDGFSTHPLIAVAFTHELDPADALTYNGNRLMLDFFNQPLTNGYGRVVNPY
jgi:hypothetical protein